MSSGNNSYNLSKNKSSIGTMNSSKKYVANKYKEVKSGSMALKVLIVLITILVIWLLVYWIYIAFKSQRADSTYSPILISTPIDGWKSYKAIKIPKPPEGQQLTISTWFYMKNFQYRLGDYKTILWLGIPPSSKLYQDSNQICLPKIQFYPYTNALSITTVTSAPDSFESCDIKNIPFNKWINLIYVLNNRSVDIYIDGKLERSCVLQGIPVFPNNNDPLMISFCNENKSTNQSGFFGKIGRTQYFAKAIETQHIRSIYERGPLGSMKYKVRFFTGGDIVDVETLGGYN